jgi:anaerobic magnesium-protoporphyrin IX monomethyl ester cyclase
MKFLFIQKNSFPAAGPMIISALLKKNGFEVDLILYAEEKKHLMREIAKASPDVVGIPCFTGQQEWAVRLCRKIKKRFPGIITLLGGPHPTYYPDIISEPGVDIIARGEAEYAMLKLMQKLQNKESIDGIKNLWIKKGGAVIKNEMDCLPENLDDLPLPDREIYYKYKFLRRVTVKQFLSGRGCPFQCTFCANNILKKIYHGKGKFVRRRSPKGVVEEILDVKKRYGLKTVSFTDDVFITDLEWLKRFLPLYKKKVGLPFMCNVTANLVTEEIASLLKENCCYGVSMGIESGDEEIRYKVMKKFISNKQIIESARLIKKYKLSLKTFNILCLPGETIGKALGTMELNARIKSDFAACTLLQTFPDYDITDYAKENGFLPADFNIKDVSTNLRLGSPIILKDKNQFINLQKLFFLGVRLPWTIPLIKRIIKLPPNLIFNFVGKFTYGFFMSRTFRLTFADMLNYALHIDPYDV